MAYNEAWRAYPSARSNAALAEMRRGLARGAGRPRPPEFTGKGRRMPGTVRGRARRGASTIATWGVCLSPSPTGFESRSFWRAASPGIPRGRSPGDSSTRSWSAVPGPSSISCKKNRAWALPRTRRCSTRLRGSAVSTAPCSASRSRTLQLPPAPRWRRSKTRSTRPSPAGVRLTSTAGAGAGAQELWWASISCAAGSPRPRISWTCSLGFAQALPALRRKPESRSRLCAAGQADVKRAP